MMAPSMVAAWTTMPFAADIVPLLTTLPLALVLPSTAPLLTWMPAPEVAVILPLLLTPPESVVTPVMLIPLPCAAITLVLATTPVKVAAMAGLMPMPRSEAVIVPALVMPPADEPPPKTEKKP